MRFAAQDLPSLNFPVTLMFPDRVGSSPSKDSAEHSGWRSVVIVQRRLTHYRVPLFEKMRLHLDRAGIRLRLLHGDPMPAEQSKKDQGALEWGEHLPTRYLLDGKICWQNFGDRVADSDLVIVTQENKLAYNLLAMTVARPARLAFWGHGRNMQSDAPDGLREKFKRWTTRQVDWWFAYTDMSRDFVREDGFDPGRITVLNNAVDTGAMRALCDAIQSTDIAGIRAKYGLGGGPSGIFLGSLYKDKRIEFLMEAAEKLRGRVPDFELIVVGDGPERGLVEAAAGKHDWVHWLGARHGSEKAELLKAADVMLNPGLVGLGILDSFVAGLPMVTTDCRIHSPEICYLQSGVNGLMTENSLKAFVDAAALVMGDAELRERLGRGAAQSSHDYSLEAMAERFCAGIVQCLEKVPGR